jgi:hypothetical protein
MINPFQEVNWQPGPADKRKFALSLVVGFPCVAVVLLCLRRLVTGAWHLELPLWVGAVGLGLGLLLLALPVIARPFYVAWYFLACCVGVVVGNLLFAGFYFLAVTPVGLLLRALGRPPLQKVPQREAATYWRQSRPVTDPKRYFNQF